MSESLPIQLNNNTTKNQNALGNITTFSGTITEQVS